DRRWWRRCLVRRAKRLCFEFADRGARPRQPASYEECSPRAGRELGGRESARRGQHPLREDTLSPGRLTLHGDASAEGGGRGGIRPAPVGGDARTIRRSLRRAGLSWRGGN